MRYKDELLLWYGMVAWVIAMAVALHSQSVNLDNFQSIQALNIQNCAVDK